MNTLEQAYELLRNGYEVLPVDPSTKTPIGHLVPHGVKNASSHGDTVTGWFTDTSYHVAVATGEAVLIDVDEKPEKGESGSISITEAGVSIPDSFSYPTPRGNGSMHYWFRASGEVINNAQNLNGMKGVDRRGYGGYARIPEGVVLPPASDLTLIPAWATKVREKAAQGVYGGSLEDWLATTGAGTPDAYMNGILKRILSEGLLSHQSMIHAQKAVISEAAKGRPGAETVLQNMLELWMDRSHESGDPADEWFSALTEGVSKYGEKVKQELPSKVEVEDDPEYKKDVATATRKLRVNSDAKVGFLVERGGFGLFQADDIMSASNLHSLPDAQYLIKGVLDKSEVSMFFGDSYTGKTYLALDWALRIASGTDWNGHPTKKGKVLYLAMEGHKTLRDRVEAWKHHNQVTNVEDLHIYGRTANLMHDDTVSMLADVVKREEYDLVIVDTLSRSVVGANDSDTEAMGAYVGNLTKIREAREETSVMVIHHSKKEEPEEYRGSTVLFAAMDRVLCFKADSKVRPDRKLIFQKVKDGTLPPSMGLRFADALNSGVLESSSFNAQDPVIQSLRVMLGETDSVSRVMLRDRMVADSHYSSPKSADNAIKDRVDGLQVIQQKQGGVNYLTLPTNR